MPPEQAAKLLEHVLYEQVLDCIDLDALYNIEQTLWYALGECGVPDDDVPDIAHEMIGRALDNVRHDERRTVDHGGPFGLDCALCEQEARMHARSATRASSPRTSPPSDSSPDGVS